MKKLILVAALSLAAAVCASAQDLSVLSKAARMAYDWLANEGYKPTIDEDNDVEFKVQGEYFYIDNDTNDPTLLRFLVPNVYEVDFSDEDQVMNALLTCNEFTRSKKLVSAAINRAGGVTFFASTYLAANNGDMSEFMETAIDFITRGIKSWLEIYNEMAADEGD
jgi:hypothetical protein